MPQWTIHSMEFSRPEYWSVSLLQQIFQTQELNLGLLHCRQIFYQLSYQEKKKKISGQYSAGSKTWVQYYGLEKAMAPHSSTLAWKIPWMEEPGRLQSMGLLRVGQDWATSLSLFTFMHWRRKWQPTPVFLPGASQGQESLMGCCLWDCTESDTTEAT